MSLVDPPVPDGLELHKFQREAIEYCLGRRHTLIADEPGLGKTVEALGFLNASPEIESVLVVSPANLVLNWKEEAERWLIGMWDVEAITSRALPSADANFVIVNYEKLIGTHGKDLRERLMSRRWGLLVLDEAHYVKTPSSQRGKVVLGTHILPKSKRTKKVVGDAVTEPPRDGLCQRADRIFFMTGTPIMNDPLEIHPLVSILDPDKFGGFKFLLRYAGAHKEEIHLRDGKRTIWKFDRPQHLEELAARLKKHCMIRRLKADVLPQLPPKTHQVITVPYDGFKRELGAEREAYGQFGVAAKDLEEADPTKFKELSKARHDLAVKKVPAIIRHAESLFEEGLDKLIIFAHHRDVVERLVDHFVGMDLLPAAIKGGDKADWVQSELHRFRLSPVCRVMVCSMHAAAHGHTMTSASHVLFAELDWNPAILSQATDRAHRIGQQKAVLVQYLVVENSMEARMVRRLIEKQKLAEAALDGVSS